MKEIVCSNCGGKIFTEEDGYRTCRLCGSRFAIENTAAALSSTRINLGGDVEELLRKCRKDPHHAKRYANLILDLDPSNKEARKYL